MFVLPSQAADAAIVLRLAILAQFCTNQATMVCGGPFQLGRERRGAVRHGDGSAYL